MPWITSETGGRGGKPLKRWERFHRACRSPLGGRPSPKVASVELSGPGPNSTTASLSGPGVSSPVTRHVCETVARTVIPSHSAVVDRTAAVGHAQRRARRMTDLGTAARRTPRRRRGLRAASRWPQATRETETVARLSQKQPHERLSRDSGSATRPAGAGGPSLP